MSQMLPPPRQARGMAIRGLIPRLPERGKIKIGGLGEKRISKASGNEWQAPVKYDHFVITTLQRGKDGNLLPDLAMHERFGETPTSLPVRLLYDDPTLNFPTRYACYKGRSLWCSGDGVSAQRLNDKTNEHFEVECTCPLADPAIKRSATEMRCKMNGALSVLIDGASGIGGVWKFRTTSYNSIIGLLSSMAFIRQVTGGPLANIPLKLTIQGRQAANPVDGTAVQIFVVGLEFDGDMESLQDTGHRIALHRATTHLSIEHIEDEARRALMLAPPSDAPLPGDDSAEDIVNEYYPEQTEQMAGSRPIPPRPTRSDPQFADEYIGQGLGEALSSWNLVSADGEVLHSYDNPDEVADAWAKLLRAVRTPEEFEAIYDANLSLMDGFAAEGRDDLETEITQIPRPAAITSERKETNAGLGGPNQTEVGAPLSGEHSGGDSTTTAVRSKGSAMPRATGSVDLFTQTDQELRAVAASGLKAFQTAWIKTPQQQKDLVKPMYGEYEQLAREAGV